MIFRRKKREVLSLQVNEDKCLGCGECVDACRRKVLDMDYGVDRDVAMVVQLKGCVGCGRCWLSCSTGAIELVTSENKLSMGHLR